MNMLEQLKQLLEQGKEDKDVKDYLAGLTKITPEGVTTFLDTDEGKRLLQPRLDQYHTKGLESWKEKNLSKITADAVDAEIKKRFPGETAEQKEIRELRVKQQEMERKALRAEMKNKAITFLTTKGLPVGLADYFLGEDENATLNNLATLEGIWAPALQEGVEKKFKENGRVPHNSDIDPKDLDAQIAAAEQKGDVMTSIALKALKASKNQK
jgi:predicted metal-dependent peptidase